MEHFWKNILEVFVKIFWTLLKKYFGSFWKIFWDFLKKYFENFDKNIWTILESWKRVKTNLLPALKSYGWVVGGCIWIISSALLLFSELSLFFRFDLFMNWVFFWDLTLIRLGVVAGVRAGAGAELDNINLLSVW